MEIIKSSNEVVRTTRKKRKKNSNSSSIFSIYKSEKTLKDYLFYLRKFLIYVYEIEDELHQDEVIKLLSDIEEEDVADYIHHLIHEKELKSTSVNKIISSLKSIYRELEKNGITNPMKRVPLLKSSKHNLENVLALSAEDLREIISKINITNDKKYRDYIILQTLFYTGMRSSELLNLKVKNIIKREGETVLKLEKTKSGKTQYKPLHPDCYEKIIEFTDYVFSLYGISQNKRDDMYIFSSNYENNQKMSYNNLYRLIKEYGKLITKNISPHNIRHTVATELSLQGADIIEIRDFLGHADTKVTEVYINAKNILEKRAITKLPKLD